MRTYGILAAFLSVACHAGSASAFVASGTPGALAAPGAVQPSDVSSLAPADLKQLATAAPVDAALVSSRGGARAPAKEPAKAASTLVVGAYFFLWYALNIGYNITNKKALNAIALPWSVSVLQLVVGSIFVLPVWMLKLRDAPGLNMDNVKGLSPIAACHMLSHVCAVIGLGAGAVSFVHIVKAGEPLFTALFSAIFLKQIFSPLVYLTLVPVVAGVALASLKELDFKWAALGGAMGSNLAASTRAILSKRSMGMDMGKNMTPENLYAVLTIMSSAMLLPLSAVVEGPKIQELWASTVTTKEKGNEIVYNTVASGVFFYLYNEVAFRCLGVVHPVTHAVGNTFKRVFLIATSIIVFKSKLTPLAAVGSVMAIGGVLLYSLTKEWCAKQDAIKAQAHK
eukprot:g12850.t1